jgi:hypothetical protein
MNDHSLRFDTELGRNLRLLLLEIETLGESLDSSTQFCQRLSGHPGVQVLVEHLALDAPVGEIERSLVKAREHEVDAVLVWAGARALPTPSTRPVQTQTHGATSQWPSVVVDEAERINLFDHCFIAVIGDEVNRRDARRLGFEDGFEGAIPLRSLVERLQREAALRSRNPGSSPPCYL